MNIDLISVLCLPIQRNVLCRFPGVSLTSKCCLAVCSEASTMWADIKRRIGWDMEAVAKGAHLLKVFAQSASCGHQPRPDLHIGEYNGSMWQNLS